MKNLINREAVRRLAICSSGRKASLAQKAPLAAVIIIAVIITVSCGSLPVDHSYSQSWTISNNTNKTWTTIGLLGINIDRLGYDTLEKEISKLIPLYFWDHRCKVVNISEQPEYSAEINFYERNYTSGWQNKKSLTVEVCIWPSGASHNLLPAAVGRVIHTGDLSFSSSHTTERLLRKAIKIATKKLAAHKNSRSK